MRNRRGFSVVELLLIIVVVGGIGWWFFGGSSADSKADEIISDMRGLKSACLMYYADNMDKPKELAALSGHIERLARYIDNPNKFSVNGRPAAIAITKEGGWWIGYHVGDDSAVHKKLAEKAYADGLCGSMNKSNIYSGGNAVYMLVREGVPASEYGTLDAALDLFFIGKDIIDFFMD